MIKFIKKLFTLNEEEGLFQEMLERSDEKGTLPSITDKGVLKVSYKNLQNSKFYKKMEYV